MLTLVADGSEALIAHIPERGEATAVRTTESSPMPRRRGVPDPRSDAAEGEDDDWL